MLRYLLMVVFISCLPDRGFRRLLISRQEAGHPVERVDVFRLAVEAGDRQVTAGLAKVAA